MDTNEYLFSLNEQQKQSFSRRRSNNRAKMQRWAKKWEEVGEGVGGGGVSEKGEGLHGRKGIACSQSQTFYRTPFAHKSKYDESIKIWNLSFIHNPTKLKIDMTESEESFEGVFQFSVQETSKDLLQNGKLVVLKPEQEVAIRDKSVNRISLQSTYQIPVGDYKMPPLFACRFADML